MEAPLAALEIAVADPLPVALRRQAVALGTQPAVVQQLEVATRALVVPPTWTRAVK